MGFECKLAILCCSVLDRFPPGFVGFLPLEGAASTKTSTPTPRFETFPDFSDSISIHVYKSGKFRENDMGFECTVQVL